MKKPSSSLAQALRRGLQAAVWWAVAVVGLVGAATAFVAMHAQIALHMDLLARSIGYQTEAAVSFRDPEAGREAMQAVLKRENLAYIRLVLPDGSLFAEVNATPVGEWVSKVQAVLVRLFPLRVKLPLVDTKPELGFVEIQASSSSLVELLFDYLVGIGAAMAVTAGVAALVSRKVERQIAKPIESLRQLTRQIRNDHAFDRRAPAAGIEEIDALSEDFNALLAVVQAHETQMLQRQSVLMQDNEALFHQASHDTLTGLPNRAHLHLRLTDALQRRGEHEFAVLFIDADGLKLVNDRHGHSVGDVLLQAVASRLRRALRESDCVARLGGDEYAVLIEPLLHREQVQVLSDKIQAHISAPLPMADGLVLQPSVSIGWSICPRDGSDVEGLLEHADQAMYENKKKKRRAQSPVAP